MTAPSPPLHLVERVARRLSGPMALADKPAPQVAAPVVRLPATAFAGTKRPGAAVRPAPIALPPGETISAARLEQGGMIEQMTEGNRIWEEFRIAQTQLTVDPGASAGQNDVCANVCLVTSALPREGKSFCAINLAASLARHSTSKVLLVDVTAQPNCLSTKLAIPSGRFGLRDLAASPGADPAKAVVATPMPNLLFMPIGARHEDRSLPIASAIQELSCSFGDHFLILDAPACLCSSTPSTLAALVGQIVLIVEAERTQRKEIEAALDLIEACSNVKLILNKIESSASHTFGAYRNAPYHATARNS